MIIIIIIIIITCAGGAVGLMVSALNSALSGLGWVLATWSLQCCVLRQDT